MTNYLIYDTYFSQLSNSRTNFKSKNNESKNKHLTFIDEFINKPVLRTDVLEIQDEGVTDNTEHYLKLLKEGYNISLVSSNSNLGSIDKILNVANENDSEVYLLNDPVHSNFKDFVYPILKKANQYNFNKLYVTINSTDKTTENIHKRISEMKGINPNVRVAVTPGRNYEVGRKIKENNEDNKIRDVEDSLDYKDRLSNNRDKITEALIDNKVIFVLLQPEEGLRNNQKLNKLRHIKSVITTDRKLMPFEVESRRLL